MTFQAHIAFDNVQVVGYKFVFENLFHDKNIPFGGHSLVGVCILSWIRNNVSVNSDSESWCTG